jgi:hypothetical protein
MEGLYNPDLTMDLSTDDDDVQLMMVKASANPQAADYIKRLPAINEQASDMELEMQLSSHTFFIRELQAQAQARLEVISSLQHYS